MSTYEALKLPRNWASAELSLMSALINGDRGKNYPSRSELTTEGIPFVNAGQLSGGQIEADGAGYLTRAQFDQLRSGKFLRGDILYCIRGSLGKSALNLILPEGAIASSLIIIRPDERVSGKYIHYFLQSPFATRQIAAYDNGTAQPNLSGADLARFRVPLAPSKEQIRIVAKIEELFSELESGMDALMSAREQLKAYQQSVLKHAFEGKITDAWRKRTASSSQPRNTLIEQLPKARAAYHAEQLRQWEAAVRAWGESGEKGKRPSKPEKPADVMLVSEQDIARLPTIPTPWSYIRLDTLAQIGSGMSVSKDRSLDDPIEVPYLRVANVQRGRLDLAQMKTMRVEKTQLAQLALKEWDVLFNEGGDRDKLGRGWIWEGQIHSCITQNHVFRASLYLGSEVHAKFISYWGNTFGQDYFITEGKQTTNLASINKAVLSAFPVPMPSMQEQAEIVREIEEKLSACEHMLTEIDEQLVRANALRQSILKHAFSGQLVAQDPTDDPASALLERMRAGRAASDSKKMGRKGKNDKNGRKKAA